VTAAVLLPAAVNVHHVGVVSVGDHAAQDFAHVQEVAAAAAAAAKGDGRDGSDGSPAAAA